MDGGIRHLRDRFTIESTKFILIGDFPSVSCMSYLVDDNVIPPFPRREWTECLRTADADQDVNLKVMLQNLRSCLENVYMDATPKASQAMVYVLSDLTRSPNQMKTPYVMSKHIQFYKLQQLRAW